MAIKLIAAIVLTSQDLLKDAYAIANMACTFTLYMALQPYIFILMDLAVAHED